MLTVVGPATTCRSRSAARTTRYGRCILSKCVLSARHRLSRGRAPSQRIAPEHRRIAHSAISIVPLRHTASRSGYSPHARPLLRRFEPFAALEWTTLCSVARHARLLRFAGTTHACRRIGRKHHGSCYLVKGVVRRRDKSGREAADRRSGRGGAARAVDCRRRHVVETMGAVTLLWIDLDPVAFMLGADTAGYAVERLDTAPDDHWMHRFLGPGLVECLTPDALQSVFRAFDAADASKPARPSCAKANRPIRFTCSPTDRQRCGAPIEGWPP